MPLSALRPTDPTAVGAYRLLARLGQGGMGTVFLGVTGDHRAVAIKVLRDGPTELEARHRFRHELTALRRVRGPHLVELLDADVEADQPYLVTRFVPGERLDDVVQRDGPLDGEGLHRLARGLADALSSLHAAGVVHRDLTPGNVLLLDGEPHVIDLGLATAVDVTAITRSGLIVGTPGYLSPEQVRGGPVTPATDVHAWGATLAYAATGRPPFGTGRPEAVLYRIVHETPDLAEVAAGFRQLVRAAMAPDPDRRPRASALLAHLGGTTDAAPVTVRLPDDVDATTVLRTATLVADTRLVSAGHAGGPGGWDHDQVPHGWDDDAAPVEGYRDRDTGGEGDLSGDRTSTARSLQLLASSLAALAVLGAATLVAPVLGAAAAIVVLVLLRAAGRGSARLQDRRGRRGDRRRDPLLATLAAPWHAVLATLETALSLPVVLVLAALPAGAVYLADPVVSGLERDELAVATAVVVGTVVGLYRRTHRPSRRLLRQALLFATPGPGSAMTVLTLLVAAAVLLLAAAQGQAAVWSPFDPPPP